MPRNWLSRPQWPPYLVGAAIGLLSCFSFLSVDKPIGVSTALARTVGMAECTIASSHVASNAYFTKFKPAIDWEWMLVLGLALGAFVSSRLSGARDPEVPTLWAQRFGPSPAKRYVGAFLGGAILMLGARIAGGCTSGHGISGSLQLALSGWTFFASLFLSGLATAAILFSKESRRG